MVLVLFVLISVISFIFGWCLSPYFSFFSNEGSYIGLKNYFKMRKGLKRILKNTNKNKRKVIKKDFNKPFKNLLSLNKEVLNVFINIEEKHLRETLIAYYYKKLSNERKNVLYLFNQKSLVNKNFDVRNLVISNKTDIISEFNKKLLVDSNIEDEKLLLIDYVYNYILSLKINNRMLLENTQYLPSSLIRFGTKEMIENIGEILQRKKQFENLESISRKLSK